MQRMISVLLAVAGVIHLLPVSGVLGADRLQALYGISFGEPNLEILMRHRAVLFGLLGLFLLGAALKPALRPMALIAGLVSAASFLIVAWVVGGYNEAIQRVVYADWIAVACLIAAVVLVRKAKSDR